MGKAVLNLPFSGSGWNSAMDMDGMGRTSCGYTTVSSASLISGNSSSIFKWTRAAKKTGLPLQTEGLPSLTHFRFDHPDEPMLTTLFTQDMLERGYLAYSQFKPSFAHRPEHVAAYMTAVEAAFAMIADAIHAGDGASRLNGPCARRGFYRLTS